MKGPPSSQAAHQSRPDGRVFPRLPGSRMAVPKVVEILVFAVGVHAVEEAVMAVGHELAFVGQPFERFALHDAVVIAEVLEELSLESEVAGAHPSIGLGLFGKSPHAALLRQIEHAEAGNWRNAGHRSDLAVAFVKVQQAADIDVAQTVAIGEQEGVAVYILLNLGEASAGLAIQAGIGQGHAESLFGVMAMAADLRTSPQVHGEVVIHGLIVEEVLFDGVSFVAQAQDELAEAVVGVDLHDVPEDGAATHLHHGFRAEFGLLAETRSQATAQNDDLHEAGLLDQGHYSTRRQRDSRSFWL